MPLLGLLKSLEPLVVRNSLLLTDSLEHVLDSRHHSLKSAEVDVGTGVKLVEDLVGVLLDLILNVHLSSLLVLLLTAEGVVETEVVGVTGLRVLELVVVKEGVRVGNSEEEPGLTLVDISGGGVLEEQTADESTVGGDTGTGGNHDVVGVGVLLGHEHDLTGRAGHLQLISRRGVTEEVRADSLLGGVIGLELGAPVGGTADAERSSLAGHVISVPRGGDRVESDGVGLSVLLAGARGDDTPRLSLDVGEVTLVVDDDVASLTGGLGADDALGRDNLSGERRLVLVGVDLNSRVVIVRGVLKEILLQVQRGSELGGGLRHEGRGGSDRGGEAGGNLHGEIRSV
mmetsp:Transcript_774/g.1825  ORF Transcript_774/g.1825 Transcript_774/m.1825 type:complete len:343 (-) Transcript_774:65-1093(-)